MDKPTVLLCGEGLTQYQTIPTFPQQFCERRLLKTLYVKEKMLVTRQYFCPSQKEFLGHIYFDVCKCFECGPV